MNNKKGDESSIVFWGLYLSYVSGEKFKVLFLISPQNLKLHLFSVAHGLL